MRVTDGWFSFINTVLHSFEMLKPNITNAVGPNRIKIQAEVKLTEKLIFFKGWEAEPTSSLQTHEVSCVWDCIREKAGDISF